MRKRKSQNFYTADLGAVAAAATMWPANETTNGPN
jgi:hypothetical protein